MAKERCDWLEVPDHVMEKMTPLMELGDLIRFSFACRSWKAIAQPLLPPDPKVWLIYPPQDLYANHTDSLWKSRVIFYSLSNGIRYTVETPDLAGRRIVGSSPGGWLVTIQDNGEIEVHNPLSKSLFSLPPLGTFPNVSGPVEDEYGFPVFNVSDVLADADDVREHYIGKMVMSSTQPAKATIIATHGMWRPKELAFCRGTTAKKWCNVQKHSEYDDHRGFQDIVFCRGRCFASDAIGYVFVLDEFDSETPTYKFVIKNPIAAAPPGRTLSRHYLAERDQEVVYLLRVVFAPMDYSDVETLDEFRRPYVTTEFHTAQLQQTPPRWIAFNKSSFHFFVGSNQSFALNSTLEGQQVNFTDDSEHMLGKPFGGYDYGSFDCKIPKCTLWLSDYQVAKRRKPPPLWYYFTI